MVDLNERIDWVRDTVGEGAVLCACSGGLDSTVTAALVGRAGPLISNVFVDTGLLRSDQWPFARRLFEIIGLPLNHIDASDVFLSALARVRHPEAKRRIIGREFIRIFEDYAPRLARRVPGQVFLAQGTIAVDVSESQTGVKAQHNVGGLPEDIKLPLLEPLRYLQKGTVRGLVPLLDLPIELTYREPVPGPGLAIRIVGEVTRERLRVLREVDYRVLKFSRSLRPDSYWQIFPVLLPSARSVGFFDGKRSYGYTVAIRAVRSVGGLTATVCSLPLYRLTSLADSIVCGVSEVGRVVYDITDKPPATIEWE